VATRMFDRRPAVVGDPHHRVAAIVARHGELLTRVARGYSLCADDAEDAVQRALEIYMRRVESLDPATELAWLKVVRFSEAAADVCWLPVWTRCGRRRRARRRECRLRPGVAAHCARTRVPRVAMSRSEGGRCETPARLLERAWIDVASSARCSSHASVSGATVGMLALA
jgi:hypothetical protein